MTKKQIDCPAVRAVKDHQKKKQEKTKLSEENMKKYRELTKGLH